MWAFVPKGNLKGQWPPRGSAGKGKERVVDDDINTDASYRHNIFLHFHPSTYQVTADRAHIYDMSEEDTENLRGPEPSNGHPWVITFTTITTITSLWNPVRLDL